VSGNDLGLFPIRGTEVEPLKIGKVTRRLDFLNALCAEAVQNYSFKGRVLKRARGYFMVDLTYVTIALVSASCQWNGLVSCSKRGSRLMTS
jgi:hypothetical protein